MNALAKERFHSRGRIQTALGALAVAVLIDQAGDIVFSLGSHKLQALLQNWAMGIGMSEHLVSGYLSFIALQLPGFALLGGTTFFAGLWKEKRAKAFSTWVSAFYVVAHCLGYVAVCTWLGLPVRFDMVFFTTIFCVSLLGVPVGILGWWLGTMFHRRLSGDGPPAIRSGSAPSGNTNTTG